MNDLKEKRKQLLKQRKKNKTTGEDRPPWWKRKNGGLQREEETAEQWHEEGETDRRRHGDSDDTPGEAGIQLRKWWNGRIVIYSVVCFFAVIGVISTALWSYRKIMEKLLVTVKVTEPPVITDALLPYNDYSRPGDELTEVKGIVVHYTANPGTTAEQNRNYFEGLKKSGATYASSHYIIGLDGEILRCIPDREIAYASNDRNADTLAIECCHPDDTGEFTKETYDSLLWLCAYLVGEYDLPPEAVIRHYDVSGKSCPKYYVEHEDAWVKLQEDMCLFIDEHGEEVPLE